MAKPTTSETKTDKPAAADKPKKKNPTVAQQPAAPITVPKPSKAAKPQTAVKRSKAEAAGTSISKPRAAKASVAEKAARKPAESKTSSLRELAANILSGAVVPTIDQIKALAAGFGAEKGKKPKDKKKKK